MRICILIICTVLINTWGDQPQRPNTSFGRGVMVQLFNWKFRDIDSAIPSLAKIGYRSILVSPPEKSTDKIDEWYARYQPVDFTVIDGPLGNAVSFSKMCERAHEYHIRIIADAVINHMADDTSLYKIDKSTGKVIISRFSQFRPEDFHPFRDIGKRPDTAQLHNGWLFHLPDLNTSTPHVRAALHQYLQLLDSLGADGYRIDAALHIAPDDIKEILGKYAESKEVIFEIVNKDSLSFFEPYMRIIPSASFFDFRDLYIMKKAFSAHGDLRTIMDTSLEYFPPSRAIVFIENHDIDRGRVNNGGLNGPADIDAFHISPRYLNLAYLCILARNTLEPMVYVDMINPSPQKDATPDQRFDREPIIEGIHFHNLMSDNSEMVLPGSSKNVLILQRGRDGLAVICKRKKSFLMTNVKTTLSAGHYKDLLNDSIIEVDGTGNIKSLTISHLGASLLVPYK